MESRQPFRLCGQLGCADLFGLVRKSANVLVLAAYVLLVSGQVMPVVVRSMGIPIEDVVIGDALTPGTMIKAGFLVFVGY